MLNVTLLIAVALGSPGMSRWLLKLDDGLAWVKGILFRSGGKRARRNSSR